jgi:hypothetical protein
MQDLIQNYVSDLNKLRDAFHSELEATAGEQSKAMALYAGRNEVFRQTLVSQMSTTDRSRARQQMWIR